MRNIADAAFAEYLHVNGIHERLAKDEVDTESAFLIVDHLYRRLVDPESTPAGAPANVETSQVSNHLAEHLAALMLDIETGETFDFQESFHEGSPLLNSVADKGVHIMNENVFLNSTTVTPKNRMAQNGHRLRSTKGIGGYMARGENNSQDPLAMIRHKLRILAPRGRAVRRIDGGTYNAMDDMPSDYAQLIGSAGIPFNVPLLSKVLPAYIAERAGEITIEERNKQWGLPDRHRDYYDGMLDEIF